MTLLIVAIGVAEIAGGSMIAYHAHDKDDGSAYVLVYSIGSCVYRLAVFILIWLISFKFW